MLEGREFFVSTDRKPHFYEEIRSKFPSQIQYIEYIGQYTTDIRYIPEIENVVVNALWHIDSLSLSSPMDYDARARAQQADAEFETLLRSEACLKLSALKLPQAQEKPYCDISTDVVYPYIPEVFWRKIFYALHIRVEIAIQLAGRFHAENQRSSSQLQFPPKSNNQIWPPVETN
ncbi:integrase catalytic domain-containing protein [Trichonephila clavata]|uniref:Integrase catalytic domain-containing protein n=1 Tax=Trichonephila clavata TaxID=2740835 RepID=A0A8X6LK04_TRICU|nr:integrase catalytic domain-containing protein [Trichonephila clavata]